MVVYLLIFISVKSGLTIGNKYKMKVIALSDLHGSLIDIEEKFDLLLICGDTCPVFTHKRRFQEEWLNDDFVEWVMNLPFNDENSRVIMIAGNHDFYLEGISFKKEKEWLDKFDGRLVYLDNEEYDYIYGDNHDKTLKIFGCPYCKPLPNWAFVRENLFKYYSFIPYDLDILITHDAPNMDGLGITTEGRNAGTNFGNDILAEYVLDRKPKYFLCGHIHTGKHKIREYRGINVANVSILDEDYCISYKPLVFDIK